jgi:hypothetical protein
MPYAGGRRRHIIFSVLFFIIFPALFFLIFFMILLLHSTISHKMIKYKVFS